MASGDQPVLQINAAQPRHLHIGNEARCVVDLLRVEKFLGRAKRGSVVAQRSNEHFRRFAHGFVVIDNRNYWNIWRQVRTPLRGQRIVQFRGPFLIGPRGICP